LQVVQLVGFAMLAMIMVVVFFSDISKLIGGQIPQ
jgi:hypothetical protein